MIFARSSDNFTSSVTVIVPDTVKSALSSVSRSGSAAMPMVLSVNRTSSTSTYELELEIVSPAVVLVAAVCVITAASSERSTSFVTSSLAVTLTYPSARVRRSTSPLTPI